MTLEQMLEGAECVMKVHGLWHARRSGGAYNLVGASTAAEALRAAYGTQPAPVTAAPVDDDLFGDDNADLF